MMELRVGLWIDHAKAVIVRLDAKGSTVETIESNVEPRVRMSGGSRSKTGYGPQEVASESTRDARHKQQLNSFYDEIIRAIANAEAILIMGPGEGKKELESRIARKKELSHRVVGVETADKMTDGQIRDRVQEYFRQKR
jgi:hypothetical protein